MGQAVGACMSIRRLIGGGVVVVAIAVFAACSSTQESVSPNALDDDAITVGSFDFAESTLLAEIYSQAVESKGFEVERRFGIGPRELVLPAMSAGFIEFVPEYLGTALQFLSLGAAAQKSDASSTHSALDQTLRESDLVALASSPAQDANAFFVTRATAERDDLVEAQRRGERRREAHVRRTGRVRVTSALPGRAARRVRAHLQARRHRSTQAARSHVRRCATARSTSHLLFTTDPAIDTEGLRRAARTTRVCNRQRTSRRSFAPELVDRWGADFVEIVDASLPSLTTAEPPELNAEWRTTTVTSARSPRAWLSEQGLDVTIGDEVAADRRIRRRSGSRQPLAPPTATRTRRRRRPSGAPPPLPKHIGTHRDRMVGRTRGVHAAGRSSPTAPRHRAASPTGSTQRSSGRSPGCGRRGSRTSPTPSRAASRSGSRPWPRSC